MSLPPDQSTVNDAALGDHEGTRKTYPRLHAFIAWLESHPARDVARPDCEFVAELMAHPVYCLASQTSMQRWEVMFRHRAPSHAHSQQWQHVYGIDVGLKQRSTLLARTALSEVLVRKLMCFRGACSVGGLLHHAKCVVSRRHFLVSKGLAEGLFEEGQLQYEQHRFSDAVRSWGQAALLRHGASHAFLSNMLLEGRPDVPRDKKRAFELAAAGAAMSCAHSKGMLSICHYWFCDRDSGPCHWCGEVCCVEHPEKVIALARESAAAGSCFGQYLLGECYRTRYDGCGEDYDEVIRLFRLAAAQGLAQAQYHLGDIFLIGEMDVARDSAEAVRLYRLAAAQGYVYAQWQLGSLLHDGRYGAQDYAEAMRWYRLAAAQGDRESQSSLGYMFEHGQGVAKDRAEAIRWYRLVVTHQDPDPHLVDDAKLALGRLEIENANFAEVEEAN
jgi:TPR repeat protein